MYLLDIFLFFSFEMYVIVLDGEVCIYNGFDSIDCVVYKS